MENSLTLNFCNEFNITGTVVNYYIHCKRQCYLFYNKINLEDESELVKIGKAIHEAKETEEYGIDNIKIDKITKDYLIEIKKSDADLEAAKYQLLYYLQKLKSKGIYLKGKLEVTEKTSYKNKKNHIIELNEKNEKELTRVLQGIEKLLATDKVPEVINNKKCKKCAYYAYCYL